ncbi:MAG TPA: glycosyltransferase family 87 protein [Bryobacteraceae bacterium]|nr:glycosyltransferase family 87 protein [Bryobacteraceae bacterium]
MPRRTRSHIAVYLLISLAGAAFCTVMALRSPTAWNVDFNEFYSAGKLVGSGRLYDWAALRPIELEHTLRTVPFGRIPAFAIAFVPFSVMPYTVARALWLILGFAALAAVVALWPLSRWERLAAALCWSIPAAMCLAFGQDSVLFLFFVALGLALLRKERDFWAGVALSACAAKPHLALLLPVLLAARGKWKSLQGGIVGGAVMLLVSFAAEGADWPARLLSLSRAPEFNPAPDRMPTLAGLLSMFGGSLPVQIALSIAVVAACWILSRRLPLASAMALALAGGLLVSPHAYGYDALLLLPALMLPFETGHPLWTQTWALLLMTPLPYLILLSPRETAGHLAVSGFTLTLFALELYRIRRPVPVQKVVDAAVGSSTRKPVGPT